MERIKGCNSKGPSQNTKRMKMLVRRLNAQECKMRALEKRNQDLALELNNAKVSLASMTSEYNKLMSKNYDLVVQLNQSNVIMQEELVKVRESLDSDIISALKYIGSASEVLLNLKKKVPQFKSNINECKNDDCVVAQPVTPSPRTDITFQAYNNDSKRNQATVSPMVSGYVIGNPVISLQRLRLAPGEISVVTRDSSTIESDERRCGLSPIQEEHAGNDRIRTRLGNRGQIPQPYPGITLSDFIPDAHTEPVVRLRDVSRLLSNTSWVNFSACDESDAESTSSTPFVPATTNSSQTTDTPTINDQDFNGFDGLTSNITIRKRRIGGPKSAVGSLNETSATSTTAEISPERTAVHGELIDNDNMVLEGNSMSIIDGTVGNVYSSVREQQQQQETQTVIDVQINTVGEGCVLTSESESEGYFNNNIDISNVEHSQTECTCSSTLLTDQVTESSTLRPRSTRIKKPSTRYLESIGHIEELEGANSKDKKGNKSISSILPSSQSNSSTAECCTENVDAGARQIDISRRTSSRPKKQITYVDEPFSKKEMIRILRKGKRR